MKCTSIYIRTKRYRSNFFSQNVIYSSRYVSLVDRGDLHSLCNILYGSCNIFLIRSRVCMITTKPRSLKHRDIAPVSWENTHLFQRHKHLLQRSLRCSAEASVQYGFSVAILKLLFWQDGAEDRLSKLTARDTQTVMNSVTENTSGSSTRTNLTTKKSDYNKHL